MAEYEVVREVQNLCGNNQMRDVFFEAFETYETGCAPVIQELNNGITPERRSLTKRRVTG